MTHGPRFEEPPEQDALQTPGTHPSQNRTSDGASTLTHLSGRLLGKYRTAERIGAGAMSSVYRAVDTETGAAVALKILLPGADPLVRTRFHQEAETALQLEHPHVVRTLEVNELPGAEIAYIVMELVDGDSLSGLLERHRQLSLYDACLLLAPIARALEYAHGCGIIHRDVKPSNILLKPVADGTPGSVKLAALNGYVVPLLSDFGIARALDAPELTSAGKTVGTPAYMAPEQCSGAHDIDGRADIYALGTVLFRCLVGRPPYTGTTTQILYAHVYSPLLVPDEVLVNLPAAAVETMRRALMKEPEKRYRSAAAFAEDLSRIARPSHTRQPLVPVSRADVTMTMTALPPTESTNSSSTMLVPAPGARQETQPIAKSAAGSVRLRQSTRPTDSRSTRLRWAAGFSLLALLAVLALLLVRVLAVDLGRVLSSWSAEPTLPVAATIGPTLIPGTSTPAVVETPNDNSAVADGGPTPVESQPLGDVPMPTFDVASVWNDATFFYAERDWVSTLENLTLLLRADPEYNRNLLLNQGTRAELFVELFQQHPERPFWREWSALFSPEQITDMLFSAFAGLAAQENARNRPLAALDSFQEALRIHPDATEIAALAEATQAFATALPAGRVTDRGKLQALHVAYATTLEADDRICEAAEQLAAAVGLQSTPELVDKLIASQTQCAEEIDLAVGQVTLNLLKGTLLYSSNDGERYRIFSAPVTADAVSRLLVDDGAQPARPPLSERLLFYSTRRDSNGLAVIDLSSAQTDPNAPALRITKFAEDGHDSPAGWNPSGNRLVFASTREGDRRERVYVTWADGLDNTTAIAPGKDPAWHPTEELIVYNGVDQSGNRPGLWLIRSDGSAGRPLTSVHTDIRPTWSPTGEFVVFMSNARHGNWELYRVDLADGAVTRLTDDVAQDGLPAVSPDGKYVAFASDRGGQWSFWVVSSTGGEAARLFAPVGTLPRWLEHSLQWVK